MSDDSENGEDGPPNSKLQRLNSADDEGCLISKSSINNIIKSAIQSLNTSTTCENLTSARISTTNLPLNRASSSSQEQTMPSLPRISADAKDALACFGAVFIRKITDSALSHSKKKTLSHENVNEGLKYYGFEAIAEQCVNIAEEDKASRAANRKRKKLQRLESKGISEEELLRQQEALFEMARKEMEVNAEDMAQCQLDVINVPEAVATLACSITQSNTQIEEEDFDI